MSNNNNQNEWRDKELGVLYKNKSKDGKKEFLSGKINGQKVVVFSNKAFKEKRLKEAQSEEEQERARQIPDFTIYESQELNQRGGQSAPRGQGGGGYQRGGNQRGGYSNNQRRQASPPPRPQAQQQEVQDPLATDDVPY